MYQRSIKDTRILLVPLLDFINFVQNFHSTVSFQPVLHDWYNKGCGMCYPVCGMVHIKEPLLLIRRVAHVAAAGFVSHWVVYILVEF